MEKNRKPGERVTVILRDDRRCEAELLDANRSYDLSLLRLVKPGPYPYTPLDEKVALQLGDPVLKLGHPLGYRPGRDPVVRLGRVLYWGDDSFVPDCLISGGDSGGPLFDLDGRLVGIVRNDTMPEIIPETIQKCPDMARRVGRFCAYSTNSLIRARMDAMRRGEFPAFDLTAMANLRKATGTLPVERWSQGRAVLSAFRDVVTQARSSVVGIQDGQDVVALGTVVGADGWIVTKASQLPAEPKCRLPDGRVVGAAVAGIDPAFDLALLKVSATGLRAIEWADQPAPTAGTFLAAPGAQDLPLAVGVVSVPRRDLPGPFPTRIDPPRKRPAALPEVIGSAVQGRGYWVEFVEGRAAAAGIQPGDVILTIAGDPVRRHQDLADCVKGHWAGQRVPVRVHRAGNTLEFTMRLRAEGDSSSMSLRADDFPTVFEHDMPILDYENGGPVVDLAGKALGITIARVGPHGCMAIPGDCIQRLLPDLKSGKLAAHWSAYREALALQASPPTPPSTTQPKPGKAVSLTLDELKQKLTERAERFKSLLVEYDVVSEAHVEPRLLMA
ncbi:MAG: trypsin-like peptidase domain-containing protein [Planctomycetota bacterium]|nr:trypsin-like peptidase domain-containing protein [Planctomycetota bacterium]